MTVHSASGKNTREATTGYTVVHQGEDGAILEVHPQTGRPHQIRAQLAVIGAPIVGDRKYGSTFPFDGLGLHALALEFEHPVKKEKMRLVATPPTLWGDEILEILSGRGWAYEWVSSSSQSRGRR